MRIRRSPTLFEAREGLFVVSERWYNPHSEIGQLVEALLGSFVLTKSTDRLENGGTLYVARRRQ